MGLPRSPSVVWTRMPPGRYAVAMRKPAACRLEVDQVSASDRSGYMRGARSGLRGDWRAPYGMAFDTFTNNVQLAENFETNSSEVVGYGLAA